MGVEFKGRGRRADEAIRRALELAARDASRDRARSRTLPRKEVAALKSYTAIFERDESGSWLARIPSIRGCHTYGRTLEQARTRLREALGLWIDRPEHGGTESPGRRRAPRAVAPAGATARPGSIATADAGPELAEGGVAGRVAEDHRPGRGALSPRRCP